MNESHPLRTGATLEGTGMTERLTMENAADFAVWHGLAFDDAGKVFGGARRNDAGVINDLDKQHTHPIETGTYIVAPDRPLSLTLDGAGTLTGAISADGQYLMLINLNEG